MKIPTTTSETSIIGVRIFNVRKGVPFGTQETMFPRVHWATSEQKRKGAVRGRVSTQ